MNLHNINQLLEILEEFNREKEQSNKLMLKLYSWLEENEVFVSQVGLKEMIDAIADSSCYEDELIHKSIELVEKIKSEIIKNKMEYLYSLVRNRTNIGMALIDVLDDKEIIEKINRKAEGELEKVIQSPNSFCLYPEVIFVSLVVIAMIGYDGSFYDSVQEAYSTLYSKYSNQKIEGNIRTILSRYKNINEHNDKNRIINVVLENTIVPQNYLSAFFEFIFDIYKLNFEYGLPEELYEEFLFVFEGLQNDMTSNDKTDSISINVTHKTYKLIATTKRLIMNSNQIDSVIKLSIKIAEIIDKRYWNKEVVLDNLYLKIGYKEWEKQIKDSKAERKIINRSEFKSRWIPKLFRKDNNDIYLYPPMHRVQSKYDYHDLKIVVLNGNDVLYQDNKCDIREIIGGYTIQASPIKLSKPLNKLRYEVLAKDEIIYDSKDKLYRNYIVFDVDGNEIKNNTNYDGGVFIYSHEMIQGMKNIFSSNEYQVGFKNVEQGDSLEIENDIFNFSEISNPGIFGEVIENCFIKDDFGTRIPVYKKVDVLLFETSDISKKFEIDINDIPYKLSEMKYKEYSGKGRIKYIVNINLEKSDIYNIRVNQIISGEKNNVFEVDFAVDKSLDYSVQKMNTDTYTVMVCSEIFDDVIIKNVSSRTYKDDLISFCDGEIKCVYEIPFDFGFYRIDYKKWNNINEELWIKDISSDSKFYIFDSKTNAVSVYSDKDELLEENIKIEDKNIYKSVFIGFLLNYKNKYPFVKLKAFCNGELRFEYVCFNQCLMNEDMTKIELSENEQYIQIIPSFRGKGNVLLEVVDKYNKSIYRNANVKSNMPIMIENFVSFQEYKFSFFERANKLSLGKSKTLYETNLTFYRRSDFIDKVFKISEVTYEINEKNQLVKKIQYFNSVYIKIKDILDGTNYIGEIFSENTNYRFYLNNVNPVEIEFCSGIIEDEIEAYITNEGDGLLVDLKHHGIVNSVDAQEYPNAPDIYSYVIELKER